MPCLYSILEDFGLAKAQVHADEKNQRLQTDNS